MRVVILFVSRPIVLAIRWSIDVYLPFQVENFKSKQISIVEFISNACERKLNTTVHSQYSRLILLKKENHFDWYRIIHHQISMYLHILNFTYWLEDCFFYRNLNKMNVLQCRLFWYNANVSILCDNFSRPQRNYNNINIPKNCKRSSHLFCPNSVEKTTV